MKRKILLFAAAVLLLASCEKMNDPRNHDVPDNVSIAWLLSIEMDNLPSGSDYYGVRIIDTIAQRVEFEAYRSSVNLPELLQIPGGMVAKPNRIAAIGYGKNGEAESNTCYIAIPEVPIVHKDTDGSVLYKEYPQQVAFDTLGIAGKFHFRYD